MRLTSDFASHIVVTNSSSTGNDNSEQLLFADLFGGGVGGLTDTNSSKLFLVICTTILIAFTVLGNIGTIFAVFKMKSAHNSVSNYYIASLAGADILVALFAMTFMMLYTMVYNGHWPFSALLCDVWLLADFISCTVSLYSICAIGVDRWLNLEKPLRFFRRNKAIAKRVICGVWLVPFLLWIPVYVVINTHNTSRSSFTPRVSSCYFDWQPKYIAMVFAVPFLYLPVLVLLFLFIRISMVIRSHLVFLEKHSNQESAKGSTRDLNGDKASSRPGSRPASRPCSRMALSVSSRRLDNLCDGGGGIAGGNRTPQKSTVDLYNGGAPQLRSPVAKPGSENEETRFFLPPVTDNRRLSVDRAFKLTSPKKFERDLSEYQTNLSSRSPSRYSNLTSSTTTAVTGPPTTTIPVAVTNWSLVRSSPNDSRKSSEMSNNTTVLQHAAQMQLQQQVSFDLPPCSRPPMGTTGRRATTGTTNDAVSKRKLFSTTTQRTINGPLQPYSIREPSVHSARSGERSALSVSRQVTIDRQLSVSRESLPSESSRCSPTAHIDLIADLKRSSVTSDTAVVFTRRLLRRNQKRALVRANTETILEVSNSGFSGLFSSQTVHRLSISSQLFNKRYSLNIFSDLLPCGTTIAQQMRAAKAVGAICICFLLCWIPFLVLWPLRIFCGDDCVSQRSYNFAIWANYLNSSLNPILYALCSPRFQVVFRQLFSGYSFGVCTKEATSK